MESLYHHTNNLIQETQQCFQRLENAYGKETEPIEKEIQARIDTITSNCERLDILVHKEPVSRRATSKMRVDQLKYDNIHLQAALRNFLGREHVRRQQEAEREELLSRDFARDSDTSILIDHSLQHHTSLQNASRGVDDALLSGSGVLDSLRQQRGVLKGAHRRLFDVANTLGLSNSTMRLVERRARQDKFVLLGGVAVTLAVMTLVVVYLT
ncbi:Golgi SNAP receptor complex member 2 [Bacillus rossius redtenbacheri]|uniref:Golgi SNAP receptor complex member 2 n=1 Tax=Bacillus rossius redtenbacheri TaxID=93214 RepID=UPI002FDE63EE